MNPHAGSVTQPAHMTASGLIGGTWVREPDGACLLMYSPLLYNDPPTALKSYPRDFVRVEYDGVPKGTLVPTDVHKLAPGEWVRMH